MKHFFMYYALEVYTVLQLIFIVFAAMMGDLSIVQKLVVCDATLFILHEWEEGHYPGGFTSLITEMLSVQPSEIIKRASRIPAGILLLAMSIVPFICHDVPMITMVVATFGLFEGIVHTLGIRLFRMKHFYTPGAVTAWMELVVSVQMVWHLVSNNLGQWQDYVFGPLIMIACYIALQKTMTVLVGIKYSEVPKCVRRQWSKK